MNKFGVMQGRLLPKYQGRYQAHPLGYWKDEFYVAQEIGLDLIEFILDFNDADQNPLLYEGGVEEIQQVCRDTGVGVKTVCADYFMEAPLHNPETEKESSQILSNLIVNAKSLGVTDIVIPCVDQSSLNNDVAVGRFVTSVARFFDDIKNAKINLSLETDLNALQFKALLDKLDCELITVNYDVGNSASLGYDVAEELSAYGNKITDIHIKDRVINGGPVELGTGNADFKKFFEELKLFDYTGPFIMQAYRDEEGVEIFKRQLTWIKNQMEEYYAG